MKQYGLIGFPLHHSFSKKYFTKKFKTENIQNCSYELFDIDNINKLPDLLTTKQLSGLNVTIPYKEKVLPILNEIDPIAAEIGAINTIKINPLTGSLKGFNTDYYGFQKSLKPFISNKHQRALVLGTGGASKAIYYVLKKLNIECLFVSRKPSNNKQITYEEVNEYVMMHHLLIINTTPIGTSPSINEYPKIPYKHLTNEHLLYDLVYNPAKTAFLKMGEEKNCTIINGLQMLEFQAEKAWEIWNSK